MVSSVGDKPNQLPSMKYGLDQRYVGQVRSAVGRMIGDNDIPGFPGNHLGNFTDTYTQTPQVNGDMGSVDNQVTAAI